ncbi:tetratricopeptide repeat protein [Tellurirhabdus rosea]|uniref:tetratricopeptide repeat protein n=1 Tax=Tellurirhabdus rosea TaxID=2674997 RepID=UPI0022511496|nr:tetratricopeptide repeat protein [Tellurirhabdus rosea]
MHVELVAKKTAGGRLARRVLAGAAMVLLLSWPAFAADFDFTPPLQRAYQDLFSLKVGAGRRAIGPELARRNGIAVYLDNFGDMLTLLTSDDRTLYKTLEKRQEQRLELLDDLDENSPWQRFAQAEVRLHWAFVKLKFGHEVSACWDIIRAYRLLEDNRKRFPDFLPTRKSLGVLHVLIGSVPNNYTWAIKMMGLKGSVQQGMQEIGEVSRKEALFGTEARLIDLLLRGHVLTFTPEDAARTRQLVRDHPDNLMISLFAASLLMKDARSEEAQALLLERPKGPEYLPYPFIEYQLGEIQLQKGNYPQALGHYRAFLGQYKGVNFRKDTYYRQFLCFWLTGQEAQAVPLLQQAQKTGTTSVEADKAAQKFADAFFRKGISPRQKILLKARFATDGGYLDSARNTLRPFSEKDFPLTPEKAEFQYRQGRIFQRRGEPLAAIPHFERAIALSEADQLSFGATSALQLGYIYKQQNKPAQARQYFQKALSYEKHEYKNSVDNKARAGLQ